MPIFSPFNKFRLLWDFSILVITICHFFFLLPLVTFPKDLFQNIYYNWLFVFSIACCLENLRIMQRYYFSCWNFKPGYTKIDRKSKKKL